MTQLLTRQLKMGLGLGGRVRLHSKNVVSWVGSNRRKGIIKKLKDWGILGHDPWYRTQQDGIRGLSMSYWFLPEFAGDDEIATRPLASPHAVQRMAEAYAVRYEAMRADHLLSALYDAAAAIRPAPNAPPNVRVDSMYEGPGPMPERVGVGRRVYNGFTNVARQDRCWLRIDGEEVYGVDTAASQPFLLSAVVGMCTGKVPIHRDLPEEVLEGVEVAKAGLEGRDVIPSHCLYPPHDYDQDVLAGGMYERLMTETGLPRDVCKVGWMVVAYGVPPEVALEEGFIHKLNRSEDDEAVRRAFKKLYPDMYDVLRRLWAVFGRGGLPVLMQRLESYLFVDRVAVRLLAEPTGIPFATCHDAVLCRHRDLTLVRDTIELTYREILGVCPQVKDENWTRPQAKRAKAGKKQRVRIRPEDLVPEPVTVGRHPKLNRSEASGPCESHPYRSAWSEGWLGAVDWVVETLQVRQGKGPRDHRARVYDSVRHLAGASEGGLAGMVEALESDGSVKSPVEASRWRTDDWRVRGDLSDLWTHDAEAACYDTDHPQETSSC